MSVVGSGTSTLAAALTPVIDAGELPKRYGGEAEAFDSATALTSAPREAPAASATSDLINNEQ